MSVLIRTAGRRDLDAIHALWRQLREDQAKADPRLALAHDAESRAREHREIVLADPRTRYFVAEEQGRIVGYLHAQVEGADPIYAQGKRGSIVDLVVLEDRRRAGIGARLLESSREWFRSLGLHELRIELPALAEEAQAFVRGAGAEPIAVVFAASLERD